MAPGIQICDLSPGGSVMAPVQLSLEQQRAADVVGLVNRAANVIPLTPMDSGLMFREVSLSLATLASNGAIEFKEAGVELIFSQVGSSPGALVQLKAGGTISTLAPGCRLSQPFEGFTILAATNCGTVGTARFIVVKQAGYSYQEPVTIAPLQSQNTLLGGTDSAGALTFISVAQAADPSGASPTGSFDVTGWKAIDVYLDTGAAAETLSVAVWWQPRGSTQWFCSSLQTVDIAAVTGVTSFPRLQQFSMELFGEAGKLYFEPVSMSTQTACGFHVKGVY